MKKIIAIFQKETILRFTSPVEWLFFLILPLFFTFVLAGGTAGNMDTRTRLAVVDMTLPAPGAPGAVQLEVDRLQLEVVIRADALEVGDRVGGLIRRIPNNSAGPDVAALNQLVRQLKLKFPQQRDASVLAEADTAYDRIVKVMDAVRSAHSMDGTQLMRAELFPDIALGDAPVRPR